MKYLKKFETELEYQNFKDSSNYVTPNVSLISSVIKVFFDGGVLNGYEIFKASDGDFRDKNNQEILILK